MNDEIEYYTVPLTTCQECGDECAYGAHEDDVFFCNDCWDKYELAKKQKKKDQKRRKERKKLDEEKWDRREMQKMQIQQSLQKEADQRAQIEKLRLFLSDLDQVREFYSDLIEESKGVPPEIPLIAIHFNPDDVIPILLELLYDPHMIDMYHPVHLLEWYILLHVAGEARSDLGREIITAYLTKPGIEIHRTLPLSWQIKNRVPCDVKRGGKLNNAGHVIMLMNDSQHFMQTIAENSWQPHISRSWYLHLYADEHIRNFINPNFDVDPQAHNPSEVQTADMLQTGESSYDRHWYNTSLGRQYIDGGRVMNFVDWITRTEFCLYRRSRGEKMRYNCVKNVIEWCLRQKADFSTSNLVAVFLETMVPSSWTLEIGFLVSQGCRLPEDYEFSSVIAKGVYKRSLKASRKQFRDTARAVGRALKNYDQINEIIVYLIVDFMVANSGQFVEAS